MSDIISIAHLHRNFKSIEEWREFAEKQLITINFLQEANAQLQKEVGELQKLVGSVGQSSVERIIVSPEQALLEGQIDLIQKRAYSNELSLEDIKKLDILLKHHRILKGDIKDLEGTAKKVELSQADLLKLAQSPSNGS